MLCGSLLSSSMVCNTKRNICNTKQSICKRKSSLCNTKRTARCSLFRLCNTKRTFSLLNFASCAFSFTIHLYFRRRRKKKGKYEKRGMSSNPAGCTTSSRIKGGNCEMRGMCTAAGNVFSSGDTCQQRGYVSAAGIRVSSGGTCQWRGIRGESVQTCL